MENNRGKSEMTPAGLGIGSWEPWAVPADPSFSSGSSMVFVFLSQGDFHCNNFAPVRRQPGVRSIFIAR